VTPRHIEPHLDDRELEEDAPTLEEFDAELERQQARERAEAERQRLEGLKKHGRDLALWTLLPAEGRVRVYEDLEEFVTSRRVPPSLSVSEAELVVSARVQQVAKQYRESENQRVTKEREAAEQRQRAEEERSQKERDAENGRRKEEDDARRLKALLDHGINYARGETITDWDTSEADRARREVERTLREKIKPAWSEADVKDVVDNVLAQWEDDEADEEEEYDEEDEGEEDEPDDESW